MNQKNIYGMLMHTKCLLILFAVFIMAQMSFAQVMPKREFRGAWMQCVNGMYLGKSMGEVRDMLTSQLDVLQKANINVIVFQVRPEGDALYRSPYEPWSRYLTGVQGKAPEDGWDPLEWMVEQCHKRGMECHAWINPYRAKTKGTTVLDPTHAAKMYPDRVFEYRDLLIFNPALKENREYTCMIAKDIVTRYDVDGLHIDDYFYPYPEAGLEMPDREYYEADKRKFKNIEDWRRDNVNKLIQDLCKTIHKAKPWVKFGVSPFGIYKNAPGGVNGKNCAEGSATGGTQNYSDLYADVKLWSDKGWIDYMVPQIYWNIGTKVADYEILCNWWNDYCSKRPLVIGQDVERTVKGVDPMDPNQHQMIRKYAIQRAMPNVVGSCQWYAAAVVTNTGNYATVLQQRIHKNPSLQPEMKFLSKKKPGMPSKVDFAPSSGGVTVSWIAPKYKDELTRPSAYTIYTFKAGEKVNTTDGSHIYAIVQDTKCTLPSGLNGGTIVITALNRIHNESKPLVVKL